MQNMDIREKERLTELRIQSLQLAKNFRSLGEDGDQKTYTDQLIASAENVYAYITKDIVDPE